MHQLRIYLYRSHLTVRTHAHTWSRCVPHFAQFIPMHLHWLKRFERSSVCFSKVIPSATMSLLGVLEITPFLLVFASSITTPTPPTGIRLALEWTVWPSGPVRLRTQLMSPSSASTSVASTRRSIFLPERSSFQLERASIQATGANVDRESGVPTIFSSLSKGERDRDQNVVHSLREKIYKKSLLFRRINQEFESHRLQLQQANQ